MKAAVLLLPLALLGCARPAVAPVSYPFPVDSSSTTQIADGITHRFIRTPAGPWAVQVLDVDLSRCYSAVAVKGAAGAAGRRRTSDLLAELNRTREVVGGVNADFFSLAGFQGIPTGAFISDGRVIVGPYNQPVVAVDSSGLPRLTVIRSEGTIAQGASTRRVNGWNRPAPNGIAVYDPAWGPKLDTASGIIEVSVEGSTPARVVSIDTTVAGAAISANGRVIVGGRNAPADVKSWLLSLKAGDTLRVALSLAPFHPREAVGGRPMLVRDSVILPDVDTEGAVSFRNRNPRTAVGIARDGQRLILAVIDGRQPQWSAGTTLRETAEIMLALGSRDAVNLDGGGSSALVYRDPATRAFRVANKPSDATGERAVGNALAIVKGCTR